MPCSQFGIMLFGSQKTTLQKIQIILMTTKNAFDNQNNKSTIHIPRKAIFHIVKHSLPLSLNKSICFKYQIILLRNTVESLENSQQKVQRKK